MLFNDSVSDAETMRKTCRWITCSSQFGFHTTARLQIEASWDVGLCQLSNFRWFIPVVFDVYK